MISSLPVRRGVWFRCLTLLVAATLCTSCASTRLSPISGAGEQFEPLRDERRLWERSREEEQQLHENVALYHDPLLEDYLGDVVSALNPPAMAANPEISYRVRVVEDPALNAFAYAHGSLYVHTGLLARMENESQLATVLGHEMSHVENRHMLRFQRSARNKQIGLSVAALAAALIIAEKQGDAVEDHDYGKAARYGVLRDVLVGLGLQLAFIAAVNGYGRDLEREADEGGFRKMAEGGFDLTQASRIYEIMQEETGDRGKVEGFFFGSHPNLATRAASANGWAAAHPAAMQAPTHEIDHERFLRRIRPVIRDDARLNIDVGRLELAEEQLERVVRLMPEDPETHLLIGILRLAQAANAQDPSEAREWNGEAEEAFREAIRLAPERPRPHLELGLLAYRNEDFPTACVQFRHFVELAPDAEESARIRDYLLELERDRHC